MTNADSSLLTDGRRLLYGTAEFKSPDAVSTRAGRGVRQHRNFYLWKVLITSSGKMSAILSLVCQEVLAINENFK